MGIGLRPQHEQAYHPVRVVYPLGQQHWLQLRPDFRFHWRNCWRCQPGSFRLVVRHEAHILINSTREGAVNWKNQRASSDARFFWVTDMLAVTTTAKHTEKAQICSILPFPQRRKSGQIQRPDPSLRGEDELT